MADKNLPTPDQLRKLLDYDPETGRFWFKMRSREMFESDRIFKSWNTKHAGREAFLVEHDLGYKKGGVLGVIIFAHRAAWAMTHGEWPEHGIDHINGNKADNRLANLRKATQSENMRNRGPQQNNKSGFKGVFWDNQKRQWTARITLQGKQTHLGGFPTPEAAHAAYAAFVNGHHGDFANDGLAPRESVH